MTLCRHNCGRPASASMWTHRRTRSCWTCYHARYKPLRKKAAKKYRATPDGQAGYKRWMQANASKRRVYVAEGRYMWMPTPELKQQAAELITRMRDEFKQRQQSRA